MGFGVLYVARGFEDVGFFHFQVWLIVHLVGTCNICVSSDFFDSDVVNGGFDGCCNSCY